MKPYRVIELVKYSLFCLNKKDPGINISIFGKKQHGGPREILITDARTRVCQFIVELIARKVCTLFDSEMMVYARQKTTRPLQHISEVKDTLGEDTITLNANDDASKWNQSLAPNIIALCLCSFAPENLHEFICSVTSLWENKKMLIPSDYMILCDQVNYHKDDPNPQLPVPVAQLVERWTPCCESTRPGYESPRVRGATGA